MRVKQLVLVEDQQGHKWKRQVMLKTLANSCHQNLVSGQKELSLWLLVGAVVIPWVVRWVIVLSMERRVTSLLLGIGVVVNEVLSRVDLW